VFLALCSKDKTKWPLRVTLALCLKKSIQSLELFTVTTLNKRLVPQKKSKNKNLS